MKNEKLVKVVRPVKTSITVYAAWLATKGWLDAFLALDVDSRIVWSLSFLSHPDVPAPVKAEIGVTARKAGLLVVA